MRLVKRDVPALLQRMRVVSERLATPDLPQDELEGYYAELKEINAQFTARDAAQRAAIGASQTPKTAT